ncbi:MAG: hypothetical protein ABEI31_06300 [Halodesulfurarchaeum sp.]
MARLSDTLRLAGAALGVLGAALLFLEFFQLPSYIRYETDFESYSVDISPTEADEYTWFGRIGAFLLAVAFGLQLAAGFLG